MQLIHVIWYVTWYILFHGVLLLKFNWSVWIGLWAIVMFWSLKIFWMLWCVFDVWEGNVFRSVIFCVFIVVIMNEYFGKVFVEDSWVVMFYESLFEFVLEIGCVSFMALFVNPTTALFFFLFILWCRRS